MLKTDTQVLIDNNPVSVRDLYDKYAGMLLGYIFGIVKDKELAEECLIKVFCELSKYFNAQDWEGSHNWARLQRFTQVKLMAFLPASMHAVESGSSAPAMQDSNGNYLQQLTGLQKQVFVDIYYHGKAIAVLSAELNKTEEFIRKTLKEAFAILRKSGKN